MQNPDQKTFGTSIYSTLEKLSNLLINNDLMLVSAESCTGGLIAAACTELAGSSRWFDRGFVTYSNQAKQDMLGVSKDLIEEYGAVSQQVVEAMAIGAYHNAGAGNRIAVSVSGIAGPDGGTPDKPVGTVWIGYADGQQVYSQLLQLTGDRAAIRQQSVLSTLVLSIERYTGKPV